jgi:hypothetical protein
MNLPPDTDSIVNSSSRNTIACDGVNGANPLAFLAALGAFRVLNETSADMGVRIHWEARSGAWRPLFTLANQTTQDELLVRLDTTLHSHAGHAALQVDNNLKIPPQRYRQYCREAVENWLKDDSRGADFAAAFGTEVFTDNGGNIQDTAFRTMSGAGHQHFLASMRELIDQTNADHLREALFGPWEYRDPAPTLRWDPEDDRRYALRWNEPSTDPLRTVRGANRLAFEALLFLPVIPTRARAVTTGFTGQRSSNTFWTWPIWSRPLSLDVCRSVLSLAALVAENGINSYGGELTARGIVAVFRSQRIRIGKYRNFTPAEPLL